MKKFLFFLLIIFGVVFLYRKYRVAPKLEFTHLELMDRDGKIQTFGNLKSGKKIISFYASWCGDCIKELKELNQVSAEFSSIEILAITDEGLGKMIDFSSRKNYPFVFYTLRIPFSDLSINSIPVTYVLNEKGEVIYEKVGAVSWKDNSFRNHIKALLQ